MTLVYKALKKFNGGTNVERMWTSSASTTASVSSISRSRSPLLEVVSTQASSLDFENDPLVLGKRMRNLESGNDGQPEKLWTTIVPPPVDAETARDWSAALQRLNKGKMTLDREVHNGSHVVFRQC